MNVFHINQENETSQYTNKNFQSESSSINKSLGLTNSGSQEQPGFEHFMNIASTFYTKKFEEKAKELQTEAWTEIFSPGTVSQVGVFDFAQPQIQAEDSEDFLSEKINDEIKWDAAFDETLLELAFEFKCDWAQVAKKFPQPKTSTKVLKDRYRELNSVILGNKARFTAEEDKKVLKYFKIYGTNWRVISQLLPGRGPTTIKNRFYSHLRTKVQRFSSDNTPLTISRGRKSTFAGLPKLRRDSFDGGFNLQEQTLKVDFIQEPAKQQYFDCDQFFAFDSTQEAKTCEMTEEPNDLEYQNNIVSAYANQNQDQFFDFQETPSYTQQQGTIELEACNWDDYPLIEEKPKTSAKNPQALVSELNNRLSSVMSLCFQIQQEIERTKEKALQSTH